MEDEASIAIITPSRGLIFAEVAQALEKYRQEFNIHWHVSHNLPIPECFNQLTEEALAVPGTRFLWYIEEDTIPPEGSLPNLLNALEAEKADIAAIDYGFNGGWNTIVRSATDDSILFTGFGCTLMKKEIFDVMPKPYFRADRAFNLSTSQWYNTDPAKVYGMYDVDWGYRVREKGFKIVQVPGECRHLQLVSLGEKEKNHGLHTITEKDHISKKVVIPWKPF